MSKATKKFKLHPDAARGVRSVVKSLSRQDIHLVHDDIQNEALYAQLLHKQQNPDSTHPSCSLACFVRRRIIDYMRTYCNLRRGKNRDKALPLQHSLDDWVGQGNDASDGGEQSRLMQYRVEEKIDRENLPVPLGARTST